MKIGIYLFDGVEELDAVGPYEVLGAWSRNYPDDGWEVVTFADSIGPVACAKGLTILAGEDRSSVGRLDVLVHPGGAGTRPLTTSATHLDWVRSVARAETLMTSVCTGSLVYAAAGLLAGRPATTHHAAIEELRALDDTIEVRSEDRFVDDGDVVTSAGVSAGIDMALHLVRRLASSETAQAVRRYIQYDPEPPV